MPPRKQNYLKNIESREDIYSRLGIASSIGASKNEKYGLGLGGSPLRSHLRHYRDSEKDQDQGQKEAENVLGSLSSKRNQNQNLHFLVPQGYSDTTNKTNKILLNSRSNHILRDSLNHSASRNLDISNMNAEVTPRISEPVHEQSVYDTWKNKNSIKNSFDFLKNREA